MRYTRRMSRAGFAGLRPLALAAGLVAVWEGAKALFALPTYKLPHVHEILAEFWRQGAGGKPWLGIMAQNAAYTALESLAGFALGATPGWRWP